MAQATYRLSKVDGRYYFHDGKKYVLIDTGYGRTVSTDGTIGGFRVGVEDRQFLHRFNPTIMPDGSMVEAMLCPQTGYSCLLKNEDAVTIDDDARTLPPHDWFIPYVSNPWSAMPTQPFIECKVEGKEKRLFFDSGMRLAVLDDKSLVEGKRKLGEIRERIGWKFMSAMAPYYETTFEFPCGFRFDGHFEYDYSQRLLKDLFGKDHDNGFIGIEFFQQYDIFISAIDGKKGIAIIRR